MFWNKKITPEEANQMIKERNPPHKKVLTAEHKEKFTKAGGKKHYLTYRMIKRFCSPIKISDSVIAMIEKDLLNSLTKLKDNSIKEGKNVIRLDLIKDSNEQQTSITVEKNETKAT